MKNKRKVNAGVVHIGAKVGMYMYKEGLSCSIVFFREVGRSKVIVNGEIAIERGRIA